MVIDAYNFLLSEKSKKLTISKEGKKRKIETSPIRMKKAKAAESTTGDSLEQIAQEVANPDVTDDQLVSI